MQSGMRENQTNDSWGQMAPLLDEAIASLNETDRNAIVLRFVEGRDFKEVGAALGATEDSVRMRVNRAVEKLRVFLARRGVALSAAVIAGALSANAVQAAPPALLGSVAVAATKGASTTTTVATLIKGTLKLMALTKLKIAALTGVGILLASGTAIVAVKVMGPHHTVIVATDPTHPLQIGDAIEVDLTGTPMPMQPVIVTLSAKSISLPFLDAKIAVVGKSPHELEKIIHDLYVPKVFSHLSVTVTREARTLQR
jgi:DNA-binding CsgD family transcriptional regulator